MKHWALAAGGMLLLVTIGWTIWVARDFVTFGASMRRAYDVAGAKVTPPSDAKTATRRGRHLEAARRTADAEPVDSIEYGARLSRACVMCHGPNLSGGAVPGAPSSAPIPSNLTPDPTGLKGWSYSDFDRLLTTRVRKNGKKLDPAMPTDVFAKYDDRQRRALWTYLRSIPARPFGQR